MPAAVLVVGLTFALALSGCTKAIPEPSGSPSSEAPYTPPPGPSPGSSPTPAATPAGQLPVSGPASSSCVGGWRAPKRGTALYSLALRVIQSTVPVKGTVIVVEMRYFVGPESPPSEKPEIRRIQRWYVKLYAAKDIRYQGRFLVESRIFGIGVAAVAPYDTRGFSSPDWTAFQYDSGDTTPRVYPGLPGRWEGHPYDFVNGGQGVRVRGLPDKEIGCLSGT
jgi:hypothetical protein